MAPLTPSSQPSQSTSSCHGHMTKQRSLFLSSPALRVCASPITEIAEDVAVHEQQRFVRTWTVHARDSSALRKLRLATPGLTIVRVVAERFADADTDADAIARVRVTSDESQHLDGVQIHTKKRRQLRLTFAPTHTNPNAVPTERGTLVVEIDLRDPHQLHDVLTTGGADVTLHRGVLASGPDASVLLVALHESRLRVHEIGRLGRSHVQLQELFVGSAGGGEIFFQANELTVLDTFACGVLGDGCVHVLAPRMWTRRSQLVAVGQRGSIQIKATSGLATDTLTAGVYGSGRVTVASSPAIESGKLTTCRTQRLTVDGTGSLDVAGVPADRCHVRARGGACRVVVQPRQKLQVHGHGTSADAVVTCVGQLPPQMVTASTGTTTPVTCMSYYDRLIQQRIVSEAQPS